jgi:hypothetical protein
MAILVVNFGLSGIGDEQYRELTASVAEYFTQVSGLLSKIWLADPDSNTYGGSYLFESRVAIDAYLASDLMAGLRANPAMTAVTTRVFDAIEAATAITQGPLPIVATPAIV